MEEIVHVHFPNSRDNMLQEALRTFYSLREIDQLRKKPSTSELIDWIQVLLASGTSPETVSKEIPFASTLIKERNRLQLLLKRLPEEETGQQRYPTHDQLSQRYVYVHRIFL